MPLDTEGEVELIGSCEVVLFQDPPLRCHFGRHSPNCTSGTPFYRRIRLENRNVVCGSRAAAAYQVEMTQHAFSLRLRRVLGFAEQGEGKSGRGRTHMSGKWGAGPGYLEVWKVNSSDGGKTTPYPPGSERIPENEGTGTLVP